MYHFFFFYILKEKGHQQLFNRVKHNGAIGESGEKVKSEDKGRILGSDTGQEGQEEETRREKMEKREPRLMACSREVARRRGGASWQISS